MNNQEWIKNNNDILLLSNKNNVEIEGLINFLLANICMETLLGFKPSSLIHIPKMGDELKVLTILAAVINQYNCRYEVLHENNIRLTVLIYHTLTLNHCLLSRENLDYLKEQGYFIEGFSINNIFSVIKQKLENYQNNRSKITLDENHVDDYPHEIGIVLGYPIEDVLGFITNRGQNYIISGCWKVYHNAGSSKKIFQEYHRIRSEAVKYLIDNNSLPHSITF